MAAPPAPGPAPGAAAPATEISYSEYTQLAPSEISLNRRWYNRINTWTHGVLPTTPSRLGRPATLAGGDPSMQSLPGHTVLLRGEGDDETVVPGESASQAGGARMRAARATRGDKAPGKEQEKLPAIPPAPAPPAPRLTRQDSIASKRTVQTLRPDQSVSARQTPAGSFRTRPLLPEEGEAEMLRPPSGVHQATARQRASQGLTTEELKQQRMTWQQAEGTSRRASRAEIKDESPVPTRRPSEASFRQVLRPTTSDNQIAATARISAVPDIKALRPVASVEPARVPLPSSATHQPAHLPGGTDRQSTAHTHRSASRHGLDFEDPVIDHAPRKRYPDPVPMPPRSAKGNASPRPGSRTPTAHDGDHPTRVPLPPSVLSDALTEVARQHLLGGPFHQGNIPRAGSPASQRTARGPVAQLIAEDARHNTSRRASPAPSREALPPPVQPERVALPPSKATLQTSHAPRPSAASSTTPHRVPLPPSAATHAAHNVPLPSSLPAQGVTSSVTATQRNGTRRTIVQASEHGTITPHKVPLPPSTIAPSKSLAADDQSRVSGVMGDMPAAPTASRISKAGKPAKAHAEGDRQAATVVTSRPTSRSATPAAHSKPKTERSLPPVPPSSVAADPSKHRESQTYHPTEAYIAPAQTVVQSQHSVSARSGKITEAYVPASKTPEPSKLAKSAGAFGKRAKGSAPPPGLQVRAPSPELLDQEGTIYDVPYVQHDGRIESHGSGLLRSATLPAKATGMSRFMPRPQSAGRLPPQRRHDANTFGESLPSPDLAAFPPVQMPPQDPRLRFVEPAQQPRQGLFRRISDAFKGQPRQGPYPAQYPQYGAQQGYAPYQPQPVMQPMMPRENKRQHRHDQQAFRQAQQRPQPYRNADMGQTQDDWVDEEDWSQSRATPMPQVMAAPRQRPAQRAPPLARPWSRGQNAAEGARGGMFARFAPPPGPAGYDRSFDARGTLPPGGINSTMDTALGLPPGLQEPQMPPNPRQTRFAGLPPQQQRPQVRPIQRPLPPQMAQRPAPQPMYSPNQGDPGDGAWEDEMVAAWTPRPRSPNRHWSEAIAHVDRPMPSAMPPQEGMRPGGEPPFMPPGLGGAQNYADAPRPMPGGPYQSPVNGMFGPSPMAGRFGGQAAYDMAPRKRQRPDRDYYRRSTKPPRIRADTGIRSSRKARDGLQGGRLGNFYDARFAAMRPVVGTGRTRIPAMLGSSQRTPVSRPSWSSRYDQYKTRRGLGPGPMDGSYSYGLPDGSFYSRDRERERDRSRRRSTRDATRPRRSGRADGRRTGGVRSAQRTRGVAGGGAGGFPGLGALKGFFGNN